MRTVEILTLRRTRALGRLSTLQKRMERLPAGSAGVVGAAIEELTAALEEVHTATTQLQAHAEELAEATASLKSAQEQLAEFAGVLPVGCVWTNATGDVLVANEAAAELLNVPAQRLAGKPLMLFTTDRAAFTAALTALNDGFTNTVDLTVVVRPRERRPRDVRLIGRRLEHDERRCWFLSPVV